MSSWGRKVYSQSILSWEWHKTLNEYGNHDDYGRGWSLSIQTLICTFVLDNFGWPFKSRFGKFIPTVSYKTLFWFGFGMNVMKPESIGPRFEGDAV